MNKETNTWEGCFTAVVTPFKENGDMDREAFCRNVDVLIGEGLDGVVVAGCTGESWLLSEEEKKEIFRLAVNVAKGRIPVIGGTSGITAEDTASLSRCAQEIGVDGVMVLPPPLLHLSDREHFAFFKLVSDSISLPILVYNNPHRQGVDLLPEFLLKIADLDNVVAVKEASKDFARVSEVIRIVGNKVKVFAGHSSMQGLPAILMGASGWVGSMDTQLLGKEAIDMYDLLIRGEVDKARKIQFRCIALEQGMKGKKIGTFPAGLKYAMNLRHRPGGYPRKPILPLTDEEKQLMENLLKQHDLI
ncbi:MAG: 4-hydroxy-tetrahydrodipicolinate synthase [Planctomycetes bacterium]|nr:4-hydroxy-tetrahydrodipicolinate synthase [Planctomycetota bacterium]